VSRCVRPRETSHPAPAAVRSGIHEMVLVAPSDTDGPRQAVSPRALGMAHSSARPAPSLSKDSDPSGLSRGVPGPDRNTHRTPARRVLVALRVR